MIPTTDSTEELNFEDVEAMEDSRLDGLQDELESLIHSEDPVTSDQWEDLRDRVMSSRPIPPDGPIVFINSKQKERQLERRFDMAAKDGNQKVMDTLSNSFSYHMEKQTWKQMLMFCTLKVEQSKNLEPSLGSRPTTSSTGTDDGEEDTNTQEADE